MFVLAVFLYFGNYLHIQFCRVDLFTFSGGRENYDFTILVFRFDFRDYLASIWIHFIWYWAANLPQEKSYYSHKNLVCFCQHSLLIFRCGKSILAFRRAAQKLFDVLFPKLFLLYVWLLLPDISWYWLLIYWLAANLPHWRCYQFLDVWFISARLIGD